MRSPLELLQGKKVPDTNVLVGSDPIWESFVSSYLGPAGDLEELRDSHVTPNKVFRVSSESKISVTDEKLLKRLGVWDISLSLEPGSPTVYALVENAFKYTGVKPDREHVKSVHWKLFEGTGAISDIKRSWMEALQWSLLPPSPKPDLPWFNPKGFFRLKQVLRELNGYRAWVQGDTEAMKTFGVREAKVAKLKLDPLKVSESIDYLEANARGEIDEASTQILLRAIW